MAKYPSNSSVTIDGLVVNTFSTLTGISSVADGSGMPSMGTMNATLEFSADIHDQKAIPFTTVRKLYELCHLPTYAENHSDTNLAQAYSRATP